MADKPILRHDYYEPTRTKDKYALPNFRFTNNTSEKDRIDVINF